MTSLIRPRSADDVGGASLPLQLTALLLLVDYQPTWYLRMPATALAGLALLFPAVLRVPAIWLGLALVAFVRVARFYPLEDNHHYLLAYWLLSVFLALCLSHPARSLAVSARWLVALVFFWAALWKGVLSPDYMDGRFYRVSLITDPRFAAKTQLLAGIPAAEITQAHAYLEPVPGTVVAHPPPDVLESPRLWWMAGIFTWATVAIEGLVALAFLIPWGRWTPLLRNGLLLAFCWGTYALAPVLGFGWLLAAIGVGQVAERSWWRWAYVVTFFVILTVQVPWARLLLPLKAALS